MAMRETGKQRRSRIPLDYYKRPDALARFKNRLTLFAVTLAMVYWATGWLDGGDVGRMRYSRGPVASVHATWDTNCLACHEPLTPVDRKHWLFRSPFARFVGEQRAMDAKCQSCHSGPLHSSLEKPTETASCARCHREHQGRDADVARVSDHDCTVCHADLHAHRASGGTLSGKSLTITGFAHDQHPDFTSIPQEDPGKLLFSHDVHMAVGLDRAGADSAAPNTIESYKQELADPRDQAEFVRRYGRGQPETAPIQLECASCHQLDPGDFPIDSRDDTIDPARRNKADARLTRPAGEYMQPITYENHCRLCHPIRGVGDLEIPHGLEPPALRRILEGAAVKSFLQLDPKAQDDMRKPLAGSPAAARTQSAREDIAEQVRKWEASLYRDAPNCQKCHTFEGKLDEIDLESAPKSVVPTAVPDVWLKHAKFNHTAHRAVRCEMCHDDVMKKSYNSEISSGRRDVLFLKIDVCRQCHAPPSGGSTPMGGARHDCAECHSYHNGDQAYHGIGAAARDGTHDRSIDEFLAGRGAAGTNNAKRAEAKSEPLTAPED